MNATTEGLIALALILAALAAGVVGAALMSRARSLHKRSMRLDEAVAARAGKTVAAKPSKRQGWRDRIEDIGVRGLATSIGQSLVADEDRVLLDQCGVDTVVGRAWFFLARAALCIALPLGSYLLLGKGSVLAACLTVFFGFGVGYMAPKYVMSKRAAARRKRADAELPLLVDLLRLLQGVGLSVDQAMQLIEQDFAPSMPVLVTELQHASAQYRSGQTRESALQRFATVYKNDDMASIAELIVQVDRYGGGVQEPLRQFGDRMRERRRLDLKARIGQLTVKMTGVMVTTLLPALIIVTGGAGFIAIIRGVSQFGGME
ncbi:hypothetical protein WM40_12995 [Robbsia andropogonis]|uniref:Type II secretion system protein GspF domain-containing protein n=2 Tax=Robbsia andropogonis TaxID=28092 RepID=A0A0F5K0Z2_9BURK|nr:hypothetical protein WM40_12995 [Robbsia andropogonis]